MKQHIIIASTALLIGATPLMAEEMGKHHGGMHHMMQQADRNHDGKVTKSEFLSTAAQRAEKRFSHMDANHDGVLDDNDHQAHFDKMDSNHDGSISRDEFKQFHKAMKKKHHGNNKPNH